MKALNLILSLSILFAMKTLALDIDGVLDEPEWVDADSFSTFYDVFPYTLEESNKKTIVKIFSNENGIYGSKNIVLINLLHFKLK